MTTEDKIWMARNNISTYPPTEPQSSGSPEPWQAVIKFPPVWRKNKNDKKAQMIEFAKMSGADEEEAIQNLCNDNNILSPWDIRILKLLLKPKKK